MVDKIKKLIDLADSDSSIGYEIVKFILNNDEMIDSFLNKHGLSNLFFFPIGSVFYLLNLPDDVRKALAQLKDDKFKIKYLQRSTILMELKMDNSLQEALGVDEDKIEHLLSVYNQILDIPLPIRYNDKNILKEKLESVFVMFIKSGLGQKEQININIYFHNNKYRSLS